MEINTALKTARKNANLKQYQAAKKMKITQPYLSQIEQGEKTPSLDVLHMACKVYGVPIEVLFWLSATEKDVKPEKKFLFNKLKPIIDEMIKQIF